MLEHRGAPIGNTAWQRQRWHFVRRDDAIRGQVNAALPMLQTMQVNAINLEPFNGFPDD